MERGTKFVRSRHWMLLLLFTLAAEPSLADPRCAICHPREVAGYAKSGMAKSLAPMGSVPAPPAGSLEHAFSKTTFFIRTTSSTVTQGFTRKDESSEHITTFVVGSGAHASGYLIQIGDALFQSPLSFYTTRQMWDMAPGYELDPHPDFSRAVTPECVACHSGKPLPIPDALNRYQRGMFAAYGISCERCHGDTETHLKNPTRGSIINPAKLSGSARASICEQCHLVGETRIPNPTKSILDFKPGQSLEDVYTTYVAAEASGQSIKVVSHVEQLALSQCARKSNGKLWCGTCHNPHDEPSQPAAYFRERCLVCHGATLEKAHAASGRDCVACHMRQSPAKDGGHTAFTDHRIARPSDADSNLAPPNTLTAWREPEPMFRDRNLALALIAVGLQNQSSDEVVRGYRLLNRLENDFPTDPALLTSLGIVLLKGKQPAEAVKRFEKVVLLKPRYAPYRVNLARAQLAMDHPADAARELEQAILIDALFQPAVQLLNDVYRGQGQIDKATALVAKYERAMGIARH